MCEHQRKMIAALSVIAKYLPVRIRWIIVCVCACGDAVANSRRVRATTEL